MYQPVDHQNPHDLQRQVEQLAAEGYSQRAITRITGATRYAVQQVAHRAGITWDREATAEATKALQRDARLEREHFAADFRLIARTIVDRVLDSRDMDPEELKDLLWSAGSATASDVRLGKLQIESATRHAHVNDEPYAAVIEGIKQGFTILDAIPLEELEEMIHDD